MGVHKGTEATDFPDRPVALGESVMRVIVVDAASSGADLPERPVALGVAAMGDIVVDAAPPGRSKGIESAREGALLQEPGSVINAAHESV